jgi:hypothetical protein
MLPEIARQTAVFLSPLWLHLGLPDFSVLCKAYPPLARCVRVSLVVEGEDEADDLLAKALNPGERWITVHPPGHDKGVPVLITEHPDGTATVVGGAGGSLNHLKLRGIKPQAQYRQELAEKAQARRADRKEQIAADKASGVFESKQALRAQLRQKMDATRRDFIETVAQSAGWDPKELEFDEDAHADLSPEAQAKARKEHGKALFKRAKETAELNRRRLVDDHEARVAAGLGELPLQANTPEQLSAADLDPMPEKAPGLGFAPEYKARAEQQGLTASGLEEAVKALAGPSKIDAATLADKHAAAQKVQAELDLFRKVNPDTAPPNGAVLSEAVAAGEMVRALKKLRMAEKLAREEAESIDFGDTTESKAAILEVSDAAVEEAARAEMEADLRTVGTRSFLQEVEKQGGEAVLGGHVGAGAFNALNAFSQTVGGQGLIDRSVVDVLGVDGAAAVLARRLSHDLPGDEFKKVRDAMGAYHVAHFEKLEQEALAKAQEFVDAAGTIELPDASNGYEFMEAQALNAKRRAALDEAKRILGQAMGEMRGNASLVSALNGKTPQSLDVSLGKTAAASAITQLAAIGLKDEDYHLAPAGDNLVATISAQGLERLAKPVDVEGLAVIQRNVDIASGKYDEDDWLPKGFARRPDLAMQAPPGSAPRLAKAFEPGTDLSQSLRSYIGGRMADGDAITDILADVQSADFFTKAGNSATYRDALESVVPLKGENGKMRPIESLRPAFEQYAEAFVADNYGPHTSPLHKQSFDVDQKSVDALHLALAAQPEGVAAFRPLGDLSPQERMGLRSWWHKNVLKESPEQQGDRESLEKMQAAEPPKQIEDIFGEASTNPEWSAWNQSRNELAAKVNASEMNWSRYVESMGSPTKAIEAVQDLVRSSVCKNFADHYNAVAGSPVLKVGRCTIRNSLEHLDAVDPAAREARQAKTKALIDSLRERIGGKYSSGSVADKMKAAAEEKAAFEQAQMGFFSTEEAPAQEDGAPAALGSDERFTLGHAAEQKIAGMLPVMGDNYEPGKPTKVWQPSMNGKFAPQQRAIKHIKANKRTGLAYGAGSGKTAIFLGAFSDLHAEGKAHRGLFVVPSVVQGQIGGEALRFLEPGKFKWHAEPGASREERLAAYKDPSRNFVVMTHQSFRDDMVHLGAKQAGLSEDEMTAQLDTMEPSVRKAWAKAVMDKEGFAFDYTAVDEAHDTVNRAGKQNSSLSNVLDAFTDNSDYYVYASGDPVKNDASEMQDVMAKMDRGRYGDRSEFMRKYGGDTLSSKQALKRELARHIISNTISSGADVKHQLVNVELSSGQQSALNELSSAVAKMRIARMSGKVDVDAAKLISPSSFDGVPEDQHEAIAAKLQKSVGILKASAEKRIINCHPTSSKFDAVEKAALERKGKQGVVFANRREAVEQITKRLTAQGFRVITVTGSDSAEEKYKKKLMFNPEQGEAQADILVASDAAAVGMNLQSGRWLWQHDTPDTAKTHGQRNARIDRLGNTGQLELLDAVANHQSEDKARDRLTKKYGLREFMLDPLEGLDDTGLAHFLRSQAIDSANQQEGLFQ